MKDKNDVSADIGDHSKVIYQEAVRMERLVNDIFQLMKLDEGKFTIEKENCNLIEIGKKTIQKVKVAASAKELHLDFLYEPNEIMATIDPERMEQIILNLLNNAIRHTPPNGKITLKMEQNESEISITVQDNGEGIPSKDLNYIWERFYRVDQSRSTKHGAAVLD